VKEVPDTKKNEDLKPVQTSLFGNNSGTSEQKNLFSNPQKSLFGKPSEDTFPGPNSKPKFDAGPNKE